MDNKLSAPSRTMHWVDRNKIKPNDYNPNKVSRQNLELLTQSIFTNGWTLPIVVRPDGTIIDGFHRWTVAGPDWKYVPPSEEDDRRTLYERLEGKVLVVIVDHKDKAKNIYGTVTHNRARGTHLLEPMKKIVKENFPSIREEVTKDEAREIFKNDPYKLELIEEHSEDEGGLTIYRQGEYVDLCRGPHVPSTGRIQVFHLLNVAGAYWRGNSDNAMMQRIYGTAWFDKKDLKAYLKRLEEAKERDHRKLGKELDLFMISQEVGQGLPFWLPNGATIRRVLERYIVDKEVAAGYQHVYTPPIASVELYKTSGHWDHYREDMFPTMDM